MSNMTHLFNLKIDATEHHIISTSPNLIITAQGTAGEANTYMASKYGEYNYVGIAFEHKNGDKIKVPLDVIKESDPDTTIVKGPLPGDKFNASGDSIWIAEGKVLTYFVSSSPGAGGTGQNIKLLTFAANVTVSMVASSIEIV